jgi:signal transduction histidine kinase
VETFLELASLVEAIAAIGVLVALSLIVWRARTRSSMLLLAATVAGTFAGIGDFLSVQISDDAMRHAANDVADVMFVAFSALLYAFSREFRHRNRVLDIAAIAYGIVLCALIAALPARADVGAPREWWDFAFMVLLGIYFVTLMAVVSVRLWSDGNASESMVVRRRLFGMATGTTGLVIAFSITVFFNDDFGVSVARVIASASALTVALAYIQPRVARDLALRKEWPRIDDTLTGLVGMSEPEQITSAMMPLIADLVGAENVSYVDEYGQVFAHTALDGSIPEASGNGDRPTFSSDRIVVPVPRGEVIVHGNAFSPVFGVEELRLVRMLAVSMSLALRHCRQRAAERATARELDDMKNTFIAAASHDLRTPLTSVLGFAMTLEKKNVEIEAEQQAELVRHIVSGAQRLDRIIDDLLTISHWREGKPRLDAAEVDLLGIAHRVAEEAALESSTLTIEGDATILLCDEIKVERILHNLIINADKYTPEGAKIVVRITSEEDGATIVVDDDGPGIPIEYREKLFDPFERANADPTSTGSGLGLAIVAKFAEAHGGSVEVCDSPLGGARFVVHIRNTPAGAGTAADTTNMRA